MSISNPNLNLVHPSNIYNEHGVPLGAAKSNKGNRSGSIAFDLANQQQNVSDFRNGSDSS